MTVWKLLFAAVVTVAGIGLAVSKHSGAPPGAGPVKADGLLPGYLRSSSLPDGVAMLQGPPSTGSVDMKRDEDARAAALKLRGTPRYALAAADAVRVQKDTAEAFQCAFGSVISAERTPTLYKLLFRVRFDVRAASYPAKRHFERARPFAAHKARSCYPPDEKMFREDGSYPSARGAVGWAYAAVLAQLRPERARQIMERGAEFGRSRVVCDLEWLSDVEAGRTIATVTLARLRADPAFNADMALARKETRNVSPPVDGTARCARERAEVASGEPAHSPVPMTKSSQ